MNKFLGQIVVFICLNNSIMAQNYIKTPISHLFNYKGDIATISRDGKKYVEPDKSEFLKLPQQLIKTRNGLYISLIGSGRLYKAILTDNKIKFERIDSTIYFGSNFGSFNFSYRDTIYSLGGYGFWKTNGLLRYYIKQRHEWEIVKLNQEIPLLTGDKFELIWYDQVNGRLFFGFINQGPSTTIEKEPKSNVQYRTLVLDLGKKEWQKLGYLSSFLKNDLTSIRNITSSPFGQMITYRNKNLFLDFKNNRIYRLSDSKQKEIEQLATSTGDLQINYFADSTFYSWLSTSNLVDSMNISMKDLVKVDELIYNPEQSKEITKTEISTEKQLTYIVVITGLIVFSISANYYWKKRNKTKKIPVLKENNINEFAIPLSQLETEVIRVIVDHSSRGLYTKIEDVNKALGVSKKNTEIQKKQRSDIITSINKKYSYIKKNKIELIEKKRTDFDKRSFEYFINRSNLDDALSFIREEYPRVQS
jgi:hypothetical protein